MKLILFILSLLSCLNLAYTQDVDKPLITKSIYFGGGSYYVDEVQAADLKTLIESIPNIELYEIYVHGHTDNIGSLEYNQWLSDMRTDVVIQKIINNGISDQVIFEKDFGELNPVYSNDTLEGKLKNRRVDIVFKKLEM